MADGDPGIDPRYAAQFQRGYDGPLLTPPPSMQLHSTRTAPVRIEGGPPASAARVPAPPPVAARHHADEEPVDVDEPEASREAPAWIFEWALLAAGVLLLAIAAFVFWLAATDVSLYYGQYPNEQLTFIDARNQLPGPLLVAAVVAISAWLGVRALRPARPA